MTRRYTAELVEFIGPRYRGHDSEMI